MYEIVLGTMVVAGLAGGLINSFLAEPVVEKPLPFWKHLVIGLGAAFIVPVFLNMISSTLISDIAKASLSAEVFSKLLILAGFCLLAAISSRAFIRSMTDRLLKDVAAAKTEAAEANKRAANAEQIASLSVETEVPGNDAISGVPIFAEVGLTIDLPETEKKVLQAMIESRFSMRSMSGIAKDTGLSVAEVRRAIGELLLRELIAEGKNKEGQLRWYPTLEGRRAISEEKDK